MGSIPQFLNLKKPALRRLFFLRMLASSSFTRHPEVRATKPRASKDDLSVMHGPSPFEARPLCGLAPQG